MLFRNIIYLCLYIIHIYIYNILTEILIFLPSNSFVFAGTTRNWGEIEYPWMVGFLPSDLENPVEVLGIENGKLDIKISIF